MILDNWKKWRQFAEKLSAADITSKAAANSVMFSPFKTRGIVPIGGLPYIYNYDDDTSSYIFDEVEKKYFVLLLGAVFNSQFTTYNQDAALQLVGSGNKVFHADPVAYLDTTTPTGSSKGAEYKATGNSLDIFSGLSLHLGDRSGVVTAQDYALEHDITDKFAEILDPISVNEGTTSYNYSFDTESSQWTTPNKITFVYSTGLVNTTSSDITIRQVGLSKAGPVFAKPVDDPDSVPDTMMTSMGFVPAPPASGSTAIVVSPAVISDYPVLMNARTLVWKANLANPIVVPADGGETITPVKFTITVDRI